MGIRALVEVGAVGLIAGELVAGRGPAYVLGGIAIAACLAAVAWRRRGYRGAVAGAAGGLALGYTLAALTLAPSDDPADVANLVLPARGRLVGRIASLPVVTHGRTTLVLDASSFDRGEGPERVVGCVRLGLRGERPDLARGTVVGLATTLRRPRNFENPGRFDFAGQLARHGIRVVAGSWDAAGVVRLAGPPAGLTRRIDRWRRKVRAAIFRSASPETAGVLAALVVGDESRIDDDLRQAFTRAGVVHVLSVSGLHISIVAGTAAAVLAWLLGRSEWLLLRSDVRALALLASLVPTLLYGALAGFQVATLRSVAMAMAGVAAVSLGRRARPLRALATAAVIVAIGWPGASAEISFQLSFASVLGLVAWGERHRHVDEEAGPRWVRFAREAIGLSAAAWSATAPLTAFYFHQISLAGVVANPIVVPLFGVVVLMPALIGALLAPAAPGLAEACLWTAGHVLDVGILAVRAFGAVPWAAVATPIPTLLELALAYALVVGLWYRPARWAGAVFATALVVVALDVAGWARTRWTPGVLRATFLDVGQGDAAVIEFPDGRVLVVDAGGFPASDFDTGAAIVEPFLRTRKIETLDALVMTHAHPDHMGGLAHLVRVFRPREFWWTGVPGDGVTWRRLEEALADTATPPRVLARGADISEFPDLDVLHPPPAWTPPSQNDASLVLRIHMGRMAMLLTGDVERAAEARLLDDPSRLGADVVKVPHHGSPTSSAWPFVTAVRPTVAAISVGADNRYGHPGPDVEARYRRAGTRVLRTDRCGAIEAVTDGRSTSISVARPECERDVATMPVRP